MPERILVELDSLQFAAVRQWPIVKVSQGPPVLAVAHGSSPGEVVILRAAFEDIGWTLSAGSDFESLALVLYSDELSGRASRRLLALLDQVEELEPSLHRCARRHHGPSCDRLLDKI